MRNERPEVVLGLLETLAACCDNCDAASLLSHVSDTWAIQYGRTDSVRIPQTNLNFIQPNEQVGTPTLYNLNVVLLMLTLTVNYY